MFIQCFVYLPCSSVNVLDRHIHITRKETTTNRIETEKRIEKKTKKKKKKRRINGLVCVCVAGRYPERTSNFDTLHACIHQLTLSLMPLRVRRSKLINHRKSITRRDEGVSFASERQKRKSLMSYTTDTHRHISE